AGFAKGRGIEVHFIQWRSLKNAAGSALMYRVKLCLDGVPMHLWAPDITERIISRTCTLELVEIDLVHPVEAGDMRVNLLWAWTPNPSRIHKRVWRAKPATLSSNRSRFWRCRRSTGNRGSSI
ncbi:Os07g0515200, partial [Oryza sativa Japonica Group]